MIYLDNAATSLPKAPGVTNAMVNSVMMMGNASRGAHRAAMRASDLLYDVRSQIKRMFTTQSEENVIFALNATHAINIAVNDMAKRCRKIVVSPYEHNAVMRALKLHNLEVEVTECNVFNDEQLLEGFAKSIKNGADGAVCTCVSNVFGNKLPYEEIDALCGRHNVPLLLDASQAAGLYQFDFSQLQCDYIAMPGHKGLYGPQGTGILLCRKMPYPLIAGGTGSNSLSYDMPDFLPDRLEAGTVNLPGIAGLQKGLEFVERKTTERIREHEAKLIRIAATELKIMNEVEVIWPENRSFESGVLSFVCNRISATEAGERLAEKGFAVRSGLQCAPRAHKTAGTVATGTVRISVSAMNTPQEIDQFIETLRRIV